MKHRTCSITSLAAAAAAAVAVALPSGATAKPADGHRAYESPPSQVSTQGAGWSPISGAAYSNGNWYTSTNVRFVRDGGWVIGVQFNRVPAGGLSFYAKNYNTGIRIGSVITAPPMGEQRLGNTSPGTAFVNVFKLTNTGIGAPYDFEGSQFY